MPLTTESLQRLNALMKSIVLSVKGLPPHIADKTIYSHSKIGLGVAHLCVVQHTRALVHKHAYMTILRVDTSFPLVVYQTAVARLCSVSEPTPRALDVYFQGKCLLPESRGPQNVLSLEVYEITNTKTSCPDGMAYTDGSRIGQSTSARASAVVPNGTMYVCWNLESHVTTKPNCCTCFLGSHFGPRNSVIRLDCQEAISVVLSERSPMKEAHWVLAAQDCLSARTPGVLGV